MSSSFDYSIIPDRSWSMETIREGLRCDKPTLDRVGEALRAMLKARGLYLMPTRIQKDRTNLNEGIDEFMLRAEFRTLFRNIPTSWLKPALTAFARKGNYETRRKGGMPSAPQGRNQ